MVDGIFYCFYLIFSMYFRVRSRGPVTFKTKLYATIVPNTLQPLTIITNNMTDTAHPNPTMI